MRIVKLEYFLFATGIMFSFAGCVDKSEQDSPTASQEAAAPRMVLLDDAPTEIVKGKDTLSGVRMQCHNWDSDYDLRVGGVSVKPDSDGKAFFPLPKLRDFCEATIIVTIRTKTSTFTDTLRLKGDCDMDTTTTVTPPKPDTVKPPKPDTVKPAEPDPVVTSDKDIIFRFDKAGASQLSTNGKYKAIVTGAVWNKNENGGQFSFQQNQTIDFGVLVPNGQQEGMIQIRFKPDEAFLGRMASTIIGNDGSRVHIGVVAGQLFFQKNHDNIHRYISSKPGVLAASRWYEIRASWGSKGMILEVDGTPVAWSNDATGYQQSPWGEESNRIYSGTKGWCCMEPVRIGSALYLTGELDHVVFSATQPDVWGDGQAHACLDDKTTKVPLCGIVAPGRDNYDLW